MQNQLKTLEFYNLVRRLTNDYDFSKYEKRWIALFNKKLKTYFYDKHKINLNAVSLKTSVSSIDELNDLENYEEALVGLINLVSECINNMANIEKVSLDRFYDNNQKLSLKTTEKINQVANEIYTKREFKNEDIVKKLRNQCPLALLHYNTLRKYDRKVLINDVAYLQTYNVSTLLKKANNYYFSQSQNKSLISDLAEMKKQFVKTKQKQVLNKLWLPMSIIGGSAILLGTASFFIHRVVVWVLIFTALPIAFSILSLHEANTYLISENIIRENLNWAFESFQMIEGEDYIGDDIKPIHLKALEIYSILFLANIPIVLTLGWVYDGSFPWLKLIFLVLSYVVNIVCVWLFRISLNIADFKKNLNFPTPGPYFYIVTLITVVPSIMLPTLITIKNSLFWASLFLVFAPFAWLAVFILILIIISVLRDYGVI